MKIYECYFLDLDNTLLDFNSAKKIANEKIEKELNKYEINFDIFMDKFTKNQEILLPKLKDNTLSELEFRTKRYSDVLVEYIGSKSLDLANELNVIFTDETTKNIKLYEDVVPFIEKINK